MSNTEITVSIEHTYDGLPSDSWFEELALKVLDYLECKEPVELSIMITGNTEIQQLNNMYKGEDAPTDVLSFAMIDENAESGPVNFILPPDGIRHLGEVIISYPKAVETVTGTRHDVPMELTILLVHGILHLFVMITRSLKK
jgi:probable rRNA maturation factor